MADGIGQALQGPTGGIIEGPPRDENERAQRKQGWMEMFQKPEVQAALMQFGANVTQPLMPGQSQAGHFSSALASGAGAAGRARQLQQAEETQQKTTELEERKVSATEQQAEASSKLATTKAEQLPRQVDVAEKHAEASTTQAAASQTQAQTQALAEQRRQEMVEFEKKNLSADTQAKLANIGTDRIRANAARISAENDQALIEARKNYYEAQAQLQEASARKIERGDDDKGATQVYVESIADALKANYKAQGIEVTDDQAFLEATKFAQSAPGKTKQEWTAEQVGDLVSNSFLYSAEQQQAQLNNIMTLADSLFPETTNITGSGSGGASTGGDDTGFNIPEEDRQTFQAIGGDQAGMKLGKPINQGGKLMYQLLDKQGNVRGLWSPEDARATQTRPAPSTSNEAGGGRGPFQRSQ